MGRRKEENIITHPDHYSGLNEDIVFTVSELGFVTIDSAGHGDMLRQSDSEYENAYSIVVPNELIYTTAELTLTKTVKGILGDRNQNFRFTVNVEGADSSEQYQWIKNSEPQTVPLRSGSSFMLQHGDTVVITLPQHLSVTVTEESEDYDASFKLGSGNEEKTNTKTFLFEENETLEVTNTRNGLLATGNQAQRGMAFRCTASFPHKNILYRFQTSSDRVTDYT